MTGFTAFSSCAMVVLMAALAATSPGLAQESPDLAAIRAQGWTGSLLAPSPAVPRAGRMAAEPYFLGKRGAGAFDNNSDLHSSPAGADQFRSFASLQYGVSDHFSIQLVPAFAHSLSGSGALGLADLPVRVKYRWLDGGAEIWRPSLTSTLGVVLPVGKFDNLRKASDGFGGGAAMAMEQILLQSVFLTGDHPNRMRLWGTLSQPLNSVSLHGISTYGTGAGFAGSAAPGSSAELGIAEEFGIDSYWVLSMDVVQNLAKGAHLRGSGLTGGMRDVPISGLSLAPAIEYNFSTSIGVIAGVQFSAFGRNTPCIVVPQLAVNMFFD